MKPFIRLLLSLTALLTGPWLVFPASAQVRQASGEAVLIQLRRLEVASGQYSGITPIGEESYAVVHDKARGGGLFIFTLGFGEDGTIGPVHAFETDAGGPSGRDNEDVVFVPESRTLFVASEGDQRIREYDLSGRETGRELAVPEQFKAIRSNAGFEALAYADGNFWTTTETPLPADSASGLHRIQRFRLVGLIPCEQYLYKADEPVVPAREAQAAQAYVCGISAMTALPDGSLLVLEREVYVPSGGFLQMLSAFSLVRLYRVSPLSDSGEVLEKSLVTSFRTGALNLANFEGMCLGPVLPDGRRTLLMLADSQGSAGGLVGEYIRVMALP